MKRPCPPTFRGAFGLVIVLVLFALGLTGFRIGWRNLWLSLDQRGRLLLERRDPVAAAASFRDPEWRGVAQFRAGDFKAAAQTFAGVDGPGGAYDRGNALVMLGKYDEAIASYDRALTLKPGWPDAASNRNLAHIRADRLKVKGGNTDDAEATPDQVVYDKSQKGGADTTVQGDRPQMSDEAIRAMWLKRVQTRPADFLRARFSSQLQLSEAHGEAPP